MRKTMFMLLAAALLVVTGCKKDDKTTEGEKMTFSAGFDNGGAKTEINDVTLAMSWTKDDAVMINGKTFTADKGGASTTLSGEKTYQEGGLYKAYFPASIWDNGTLTLPATQTYNGTNLSGVNPMYAQSENTSLTFSNLCSMVKLQLTGTKTVTEIRVSADQPLSGEFEVAESGSGYKAVLKSKTGNAGVTLSCGTGVSLSENNVFYVALPEGTYTNLKFKVVASDGMMATIETASASLTANNLHKLEREPEFKDPVSPSEVTVTAGCVSCTYSVGGTVTVPEGSHTCEYGLVYCPTSAGHIPTVADSKIVVNTETFSGSKTFTADLGVLENGVEYKVRAYAMIEGVAYSSEGTVKTVTGGNVPQPMTWANGKSPKKFTVASGKQVYFSQGNLQYIGSAATPYWKFADHQFDFLGNNGQGSTSQAADRDLFGWGSTGNAPTGDSYYVNYQPWATSTSYISSFYNYFGYGPSANRPHPTGGVDERNLLVSNGSDWGANAISNGGGSSWRTLTKDEWVYLINTRKDGSGKLLYGEGKVGGCTPGLIILPDDWSCPSGLTDVVRGKSSWSNVYSYSEWAQMEAAGAVFLPAAGSRGDTLVDFVGSEGDYWSSSYSGTDGACYLNFLSGNVYPNGTDDNNFRCIGRSVRLVSEN